MLVYEFEFRRKVKFGDVCLGVDSIWIVFKRMRLDWIIKK